MRSIGVVTTSRADYSAYRPLLRALQDDPEVSLQLYVSGAHLSSEFGMTVQVIEKDGFDIAERIEVSPVSDTPEAIAEVMGRSVIGFGAAFARSRPDILVVMGDRYEMHAAALAALPFKIPVAHISGGELTFGAIDDALRHSMTKLSHLHFTATKEYAQRVIQLGENPVRVLAAGEPTLDHIEKMSFPSPEEIHVRFGIDIRRPFLLVTFHPVTLEYERTAFQTNELLAALDASGYAIVFTAPNADTSGRIIAEKIHEWIQLHPKKGMFVDNFGPEAYHTILKSALAVVGNSSSGILEAPSFKVPTVNVGKRQEGRVRAASVIDVECTKGPLLAAIQKATSAEFRRSIQAVVNPYANPEDAATAIIVHALKNVRLDDALLQKHFYDLNQ